jgi:PAS domain S-box-containing protein
MSEELRILMLEDVATDAELIERELRQGQIQFNCRCVDTPEDFCRELEEFSPNIILSDFSLPQFNALRALHLVKESGLDVPFILVTGSQSEEVAVACIREGADDYILKSSLRRLPSAVRSALRKREAEREREKAEGALRRREEYFRSLIENTMDLMTILDREGLVLYQSPSVERVLGYNPAEWIGGNVFEWMHPEDSGVMRELLLEAIVAAGTIGTWECRFRHKDGTWRVLEARGKNLLEHPEVQGVILNSRDVTERKRTGEQIREQAALLDKAKDAIFVHDLEDRITFWNRSAAKLYGWGAEEVKGRTVEELLGKADSGVFLEARRAALETGEWHGELHQLTKAGRNVVVESSWTLVGEGQGPRSVLVINTDVTERKKLEAQFLRVQRMESIGILAGGIAHDLNNVLTPVMVAIQLLREEVNSGAGQETLDTLETSVHRGAAIVQQVLSFARGVEGERTILQMRHPLNEVVSICKETFPRSIYIGTRIARELWPVEGDATQLHQVIMNLCVNARDAMPHGGRLLIEAENVWIDENYARMQPDARAGQYVVATLSDTGMGIAPEVLNHVFEPFFTTKEIGKGTGLGLSTALGIVKSHGGFLTVYSELGKGTRFKVHLPAVHQAEKALEETGKKGLPRGNGELILVADDEYAIREIMKLTLERNGYEVLSANDGTEAVALFAQHRLNVKAAVVDLMMPFMDGPATIRALQKLEPELRFVAVSGLMEQDKMSGVSESSGVRCLSKPFTTEQLLGTLHELLGGESGETR